MRLEDIKIGQKVRHKTLGCICTITRISSAFITVDLAGLASIENDQNLFWNEYELTTPDETTSP